jgi:hypothetical protein
VHFFQKIIEFVTKEFQIFTTVKFCTKKKTDGMPYLKEILSGKTNLCTKEAHFQHLRLNTQGL